MIMKKISLVAVLLMLVLCSNSCNKDDVNEKNKFHGTWNTDYNGKENNTIVFNENGTVGLYIPLEGYAYNFPKKDVISFSLSDSKWEFYYEFHSDKEITIYSFLNESITQEVKNISFFKE